MSSELKENDFPAGMVPLFAKDTFSFACHPGVECFTTCCRQLDLPLYPYDLLRLKTHLGITSAELLERYTRLGPGSNPFFPGLYLRMAENAEQTCPFLGESGCTVYRDRPTSCRTYPLERGVDRRHGRSGKSDFYLVARHDYCLGHQQEKTWTIRDWLRDQDLAEFNSMNEAWTEVETLFAANPWKGEGVAGPKQRMAFMVCYDIDGFRSFVNANQLLRKFQLGKDRTRRIESSDEALLRFGFDWLRFQLGGQPALRLR